MPTREQLIQEAQEKTKQSLIFKAYSLLNSIQITFSKELGIPRAGAFTADPAESEDIVALRIRNDDIDASGDNKGLFTRCFQKAAKQASLVCSDITFQTLDGRWEENGLEGRKFIEGSVKVPGLQVILKQAELDVFTEKLHIEVAAALQTGKAHKDNSLNERLAKRSGRDPREIRPDAGAKNLESSKSRQ